MSDAALKAEELCHMGSQICIALALEIDKLQLKEPVTLPRWEQAHFSLHRDPALGEESLEGLWLSEQGGKLGSVIIHSDNSFFADYDIIRPHPAKTKWFVEAVSAWGRGETIKSEARLLPMPED